MFGFFRKKQSQIDLDINSDGIENTLNYIPEKKYNNLKKFISEYNRDYYRKISVKIEWSTVLGVVSAGEREIKFLRRPYQVKEMTFKDNCGFSRNVTLYSENSLMTRADSLEFLDSYESFCNFLDS
jgi:hypothetical protein